MRYDQYYLVHRLSENLSEEGGGEEEEDFPHIRFSNRSDKNEMQINAELSICPQLQHFFIYQFLYI